MPIFCGFIYGNDCLLRGSMFEMPSFLFQVISLNQVLKCFNDCLPEVSTKNKEKPGKFLLK